MWNNSIKQPRVTGIPGYYQGLFRELHACPLGSAPIGPAQRRAKRVRLSGQLARPTARKQYGLVLVQNTIEPLDLNEGTLLEQRD